MAKFKVVDLIGVHIPFVGQVCKISAHGVMLEGEYEEILGFGNKDRARRNYDYCHMGGRYEMSLIFIDYPAMKINNVVFYCLKEIGEGVSGDWHWYSLNQLIICN